MRLDLRERTQACESSVVPDFNREHSVARQRDYRAEYQRRIANAVQRGLSRSQARGHARTGEAPLKPSKAGDETRLETALRTYRQTGNRSAAAKSVGIAPERLSRFLRENVQIEGRGRSLKITDNRNREMTVFSDGAKNVVRLRDFDQASLNGRHLAAVGDFLRTNDRELLMPFEGRKVIDAKGKSHPLETDPNELYGIAAQGDDVFHEIYRLIPIGG